MKLDADGSGIAIRPDRAVLPVYQSKPAPIGHWTPRYIIFKKVCDLGFGLLALPLIISVAMLLLIGNRFFNPGPVFFRQLRMGMGGKKIMLWKFRTMVDEGINLRAHNAPLEKHRIRRLGKFLRKTRLDELPNFFNVLRGEMSLVGPRPEAWDHAVEFLDTIPLYRDRFRVLPGITGLAQICGGYADNRRATTRKARLDHIYLRRSKIKLDLFIIYRTISVTLSMSGE